jgi:hypothetical protein
MNPLKSLIVAGSPRPFATTLVAPTGFVVVGK